MLVWNDECLAVISEYAVRRLSHGDRTAIGRTTHECLEALRGMYDRCRLFVLIGSRSEAIGGGVLGVELLGCEISCSCFSVTW